MKILKPSFEPKNLFFEEFGAVRRAMCEIKIAGERCGALPAGTGAVRSVRNFGYFNSTGIYRGIANDRSFLHIATSKLLPL